MNKHGVPAEIYADYRYMDIGDLPTGFGPYRELGFSKLYARPLTVREMVVLNTGMTLGANGIGHIFRAVDMAISCDVNLLTDGDFSYVSAWLRMHSYPKAPALVRWTCTRTNIVHKEGRAFYTEPDAYHLTKNELIVRGLEKEVCNAPNTEIVHNVESVINMFDDDDLVMEYDDLDFPRIGTRVELAELLDEKPELEHHAQTARWIKAGDTLAEKMEILSESKDFDQYSRILECIARYKHGVEEKMVLRCRTCDNTVKHNATFNPLTFFANNSEKDILDIQYSLLAELNLQPDDNMPAKTLLYHHACLAKDKQAEEERKRLHRAVGR